MKMFVKQLKVLVAFLSNQKIGGQLGHLAKKKINM